MDVATLGDQGVSRVLGYLGSYSVGIRRCAGCFAACWFAPVL